MFIVVRNPVNALKTRISLLKTANLTKVHCFQLNYMKMRALCGKKYYCLPLKTAFLTLFCQQNLDPGYDHALKGRTLVIKCYLTIKAAVCK